ncbi:hypothetical protein A6P39_040185 [Streptomyces sp. FXJ1.172]|uniref:hypothetical protein n=1 Tax=Streptomyces sp. FXJ1.172 TaxID=710705 RepID=UPI0007CFE4A0|nr:hypothetical protein [Streptomyces sp. FXJ1.172]WEO99767.1 hypothetical protein A6P39_040185 [Streptomyces sp. FXJ1.172]
MTDLQIPHYIPKFAHTDWIDNVDRVQAGGDNGFNARFHNVAAEFATLAQDHINPLVDALSRPQANLTLAPILTPLVTQSGDTQPPWLQGPDGARKPSDGQSQEAHGLMNVSLPDGATIQSMLVTGNQPSGTVHVILRRRDINNAQGSEPIIDAAKLNQASQPPSPPPQPGLAVVNNGTHRYFVTADLTGATGADMIQLFCIQITYQ